MRSAAFWTYFDATQARLGARAETFAKIFAYLDRFDRPVGIVETGCVRDADNWAGDGCSTLLFDAYAGSHVGSAVYTVDVDARATGLCRTLVSDCVKIHTGDSVAFLKSLADAPPSGLPALDLLYLDSYDVDFDDPNRSAVHHLKELVAANPLIRAETLVVVDDSPMTVIGHGDEAKFTSVAPPRIGGKGKYIAEYANQIGAELLFARYQCGWTKFRGAG